MRDTARSLNLACACVWRLNRIDPYTITTAVWFKRIVEISNRLGTMSIIPFLLPALRLRARAMVVLLASTLLVATGGLPAGAQRNRAGAIDTLALRARAALLADDLLAGRENGTAGQQIAALYIESELRRLGVRGGAADGSFRQPVPLGRVDVSTSDTRLTLQRAARADTLAFGTFLLRGTRPEAFRPFAGRPLFVGRAADVPALLADGRSLTGQVVVLAPGGNLDSALALIEARGAEGAVVVMLDSVRFGRATMLVESLFRYVLDAPVAGPAGRRLPQIIAGPVAAARLGVTAADTTASPRAPRALGERLRLDVSARVHPVSASNMVGRLDGSDPARRDEVVVLQAHYDHIGIGRPVNGDSIYNGFMDDATGVAAVLSAAQALADSARAGRLPRTVMFLLTTAEEAGSLGSAYYVSRPTVPLARTMATITIDLPPPLAPPLRWVLEGNDSTLVRVAAAAVRSRGWRVEGAPALPNSDHWSWIARGVPSVFVVAEEGWEGVTREQEEALIAKWWHPHQASDECMRASPPRASRVRSSCSWRSRRRTPDDPERFVPECDTAPAGQSRCGCRVDPGNRSAGCDPVEDPRPITDPWISYESACLTCRSARRRPPKQRAGWSC